MFAGKRKLLRNKCKSEMVGYDNDSTISPIVVLEKLPIKFEQASYIKEEVMISDTSYLEDELIYKNNNKSTSRNLRNRLTRSKQTCDKSKISANLGKTRVMKRKVLSNINRNGNNTSLPIVILEKLSIKNAKLNSFIKKEVIDLNETECSDNILIHKTNDIKAKKIKKQSKKLMQIPTETEDQYLLEKESFKNKQLPAEQEIIRKTIKNEQSSTEEFVNTLTVDEQKHVEDEIKNCTESNENDQMHSEQEITNETVKNQHILTTLETSISHDKEELSIINSNNTTDESCLNSKNVNNKYDKNKVITSDNIAIQMKTDDAVRHIVDDNSIIIEDCVADEIGIDRRKDILKSNNLVTKQSIDNEGDIILNNDVIIKQCSLSKDREICDPVVIDKNSFDKLQLNESNNVIDIATNNKGLQETDKQNKNKIPSPEIVCRQMAIDAIYADTENINDNSIIDTHSFDKREINEIDLVSIVDNDRRINKGEENSKKLIRAKLIYEQTTLETDEENSDSVSIEECSSTEIDIDESKGNFLVTSNYVSENIRNNSNAVEILPNQSSKLFLSLKEACETITADIDAEVGTREIQQWNEKTNSYNSGNVPELLYISGDSEDEVIILEDKGLTIDHNRSSSSITYTDRNCALVPKQNLLIPRERQSVSSSNEAISSGAQSVSSSNEAINSVTQNAQLLKEFNKEILENQVMRTPRTCPKCKGTYYGKQSIRKHLNACGVAPYLECKICPQKFKHKRGLSSHMRNHHLMEIKPGEVEKIAEEIFQRAVVSERPKEKIIPTPKVLITLPEFIVMYCTKCMTTYPSIPDSFRAECNTCRIPLKVHCKRCDRHYVTSNRIIHHMTAKCEIKPPFNCDKCDFVSNHKGHMYEHVLRRHTFVDSNEFKPCRNKCGRKFKVHGSLTKHERHCGKEPHLFCKYCPFKTKFLIAINNHMKRHLKRNSGKVIAGKKDKLIMDKKKEVIVDRAVVELNDEVETIGNKSKSTAKKKKNDSADSINVIATMTANCQRCKTSGKYNGSSSCSTCLWPLVFNCHLCKFKNPSYYSMRVHVLRGHGAKIHACSKCDRRFSFVGDCRRHESKCDKPPFRCNLCPYTARYQNNIKIHHDRRHHTNTDTSYICHQCNAKFLSRDSLLRHLRLYCNIEPALKCNHCNFKTRTKFSLIRHIWRMHNSNNGFY